MHLGLMIVAAILLSIGIAIWIMNERVDTEISFIGVLLIFSSGVLFGIADKKHEIDALDVYRGRTELEITEVVRDSVVVKRDTIVVFIDK